MRTELAHLSNYPDGAVYACACPRGRDHTAGARTPHQTIAANEVAAAVERVQGFTVLDVRYAIADEVIDALLALGWSEPSEPVRLSVDSVPLSSPES